MPRRRPVRVLVSCVALVAAPARHARAQVPARDEQPLRHTPPPPAPATRSRAVSGDVVQAETDVPLDGATVLLLPAPLGLLAADAGGGSAFVGTGRRARTDASGRYVFRDVPPGTYLLRVSRLGFRPATVEVEMRDDGAAGAGRAEGAARISVGLTVVAIRLRPVAVAGEVREPYARRARSAREVADARSAALRVRRARYLATDVREVTHADVEEALTTGETDLFRALQRLPGASTRSDATAELWTRGGRWDGTRVTFDGLPLFNPLHTGGVLSAVNADAVGAAFLFPGVRPAAIGEGGAGVLDLRSRAGAGSGELRGVGELSLLSARATLDETVADGRGAWMLSWRRSYLDLVAPRVTGDSTAQLPYHIGELAVRADWRLGPSHTLEVSALRSLDQYTAGAGARLDQNVGHWGNTVARATLTGPATLGALGAVRLRHTLGVSAYGATLALIDTLFARASAYRSTALDAAVQYVSLTGEATPDNPGPSRWVLGYAATTQQVRMAGQLRALYAADPLDTSRAARTTALPQLAVWGERRLFPTPRLTVAAGLRVEGGAPVRGDGPVRPAPRLTARYALGDSRTVLSAGLGRHFQYVQGVPGLLDAATTFLALRPVPNWVGADRATPALRTDLATAGAERWTATGWDLTANAYVRRTAGLLVPDARPGVATGRPLVVTATGRAAGVEVGVRRLVGRVTGSANYACAHATVDADGVRSPAPEDQHHVVNATGMWRVGRGLHLGAAYSAFSGAPFTRATGATVREDSAGQYTVDRPAVLGAPNTGRLPAFRRLDVSAEWAFVVRRVRAGAYVQVLNVLSHRNVVAYHGASAPGAGCPAPDLGASSACRPVDTFLDGLSALPLLGFRASF